MKFLFFIMIFICEIFATPIAPKQAFKISSDTNTTDINIHFEIADGVYLYANEIKLSLNNGFDVTKNANFPPIKTYKTHQIFDGNFTISLPYSLTFISGNSENFSVNGNFNACTKDGFCYSPQEFAFKFEKENNKFIVTKISTQNNLSNNKNLNNQSFSNDKFANSLENMNFFAAIIVFFGYGILLSLTPCVYPLIPILSSIIIAKTGAKPSVKFGFFLSFIYILGIGFSYAIMGVFVAIFGRNLQAVMQNPIFILFTSAIFVALAFAMFGLFELKFPAKLETFLHKKSQNGSGVLGVFIMGAISALIVSPCVSAPLAGALLYIGGSGNILLGALALFALGIGSGALLLFVGIGGALPRPGVWMKKVNEIFGFLMLIMAIWIARNVIGLNFALLLYAFVGFLMASSFGLFDTSSHKFIRGISLFMAVYSAILMLGFASGATKVSKPLENFKILAMQNFNDDEKNFKTVNSLDELNKILSTTKKPVMVDFWALWCKNCEENEKLFTYKNIKERLKNFELIKIDLSEENDLNISIKRVFEIYGPPSIRFFKNAKEIQNARVNGVISEKDLIKILDSVEFSDNR